MKLTLGYSPCPNDTFMFHALTRGLLSFPRQDFSVKIHDVETLNAMAFESHLDITKLSFYAWLKLKGQYKLLESGAALGFGCGPMLISREDIPLNRVSGYRIALPGEWTTAHLLFQIWAPDAKNKLFVPYDQIFDVIRQGKADCGVIIHESRFTYKKAGFRAIVDLGEWWEKKTGLPIPLGCIAVKKGLDKHITKELTNLIKASIAHAQNNPDESLPYIRKYAKEMDDAVLKTHIKTFVNEFSIDLGDIGRNAIDMLEELALKAGIII